MAARNGGIAGIANAKTAKLAQVVAAKVALAKQPPASNALALQPESLRAVRGRLYRMITATGAAEKAALLKQITDRLRLGLPVVLSKLPLQPSHFGLKNIEELVQFLEEALSGMSTKATSVAEFASKVKGWQWHFAGKVLFERLVKYHPDLVQFFREIAVEMVDDLNAVIKRRGKIVLMSVTDKNVIITSMFKHPLRVVEFSLDGVPFTDFGSIAKNAQGKWAMLPIEIKLPGAMGKAPRQMSEFLPRLAVAKEIKAIVDDGGKQRVEIIDQSKLVFERGFLKQTAVTALNEKQWLKAMADRAQRQGKRAPLTAGEIGSLSSLDEGVSPTHAVIYYRIRVLVLRDWLETIVKAITTPTR